MFDNDEEEEEMIVYNIVDDDDFDDNEEDDTPSGEDLLGASYVAKGKDDRALVDQQAKDAEEAKRRKRLELDHLKQSVLAAKSSLSKKERELATLELILKKDRYLETRERVAFARSESSEEESFAAQKNNAGDESRDIKKVGDRERREEEHKMLLGEVAKLKTAVSEIDRAISLTEGELFRS